MSEAVAAQVQSVPVPPADQPPAPVRELPFEDRYKAKQAELGVTDDDGPEEQFNLNDTPPPGEKPKEEPKRNVEPTAGDKAMFEALAKKLGYNIDGKGVLPSERIAWETAKKRQETGIAEREAKAQKMLADAESQLTSNPRVQKAEAIVTAYENGDPDGFAQALGVKDFNEFQQSFIKRLADPNYLELRKLQQWKEQQEAERKKSEEEGKQRQASEQRAQAYKAYMSNLSEVCKNSSSPLVAAMHDDPLFLQAVYRIQEENWDPVQQKTITVEEAIKKASRGANQDLESELRKLYERLGKGFTPAEAAAAAASAAAPRSGKKPAPRTAVTPPHAVSGGSAPKKPSDYSTLEWREYTRRRLEEAGDD